MATYTDPTTIVSTGKPNPVQPGAIIVLVGGLLCTLFAGFFFLENTLTSRKVDTVMADVTAKQADLATLQPTADKLQSLSNEAADLHLLFDNQKRWEAVFDKLSERLHKDMAVTSLQINEKGAVTLAGLVPDYITYAKVFQALTDSEGQKYFSAVRPAVVTKVVDAKTGDSHIAFTFNINLQPLVLNAGTTKAVPTK